MRGRKPARGLWNGKSRPARVLHAAHTGRSPVCGTAIKRNASLRLSKARMAGGAHTAAGAPVQRAQHIQHFACRGHRRHRWSAEASAR